MAAKANESICFRDNKGEERFLFQVLNLGDDKSDELKFTFNDKEMGTGVMYQETRGRIGKSDLVRMQPEISYHSDGSLLQKMVGDSGSTQTVYRNPHGEGSRRTALVDIDFWEPFLEYKIVNYDLCMKRPASNSVFAPENSSIFDGSPFECILYLGNKSNIPCKSSEKVIGFRRTEIADSVDLLIVFQNTNFQGRHVRLGNSDNWVWSTDNVVDVVERNGKEGRQNGQSSRPFRMFLDSSDGLYRSKKFEITSAQLRSVMQSMDYEESAIQEFLQEGLVVDLQEVPDSPVTIRVEREPDQSWAVSWTMEVGSQLHLPRTLSAIIENQPPAWKE